MVGHADRVEELQCGCGRPLHRGQKAGAPQGAGRRGADFAPSQLYCSELVECGALDQRVAYLAGQCESAPKDDGTGCDDANDR